jgi:outer membrane protein assembly factor BamB
MINRKSLVFFLIFILLSNCSFDDKTGIWGGSEKEKKRISELEKEQRQIIDIERVYSSENIYNDEIPLTKGISLSKSKKNQSWQMSGLNHQNFLGNIHLFGTDNVFLKKKIGKNKFTISNIASSILAFKNNIILSDDVGTIFSINVNGDINWKKNIYKKIYKKVNKNLVLAIYKNYIYVADNIGFVYAIDLDNGKINWIKNYTIPIKSNIKIFNDKIYLMDQDNKIFSLNIKDGTRIWDVLSISSFIKSQNLLSSAISKTGDLIILNSSADLYKIDGNTGEVYWYSNTLGSLLPDATDFFISSEIVIIDDEIIFSAGPSIFSYNLNVGSINWEKEVSAVGTPIVDGKNIFFTTSNGYFVIMNRKTGKIISSTNILKILKKKNRETKITNFIMGSGKLYSVTLSGHLIVSSAISGKVEYFKKIGDPVTSAPVINNGKLYILTENSRIIGFN